MQITHWKEKLSVTNVTYDRNKGSVLNLYNINKQDDSEIRIISKKDYEQYWGFPGGSADLPAKQEMQETWVWSLGREDPLEK